MSTAFIVDKDGIIIEEVVVLFTHWTPKGKMIKPSSPEEEQMLRAYSEHQQKLKALREEMIALESVIKQEQERSDISSQKVEETFAQIQAQEHEMYIPGELVALMEQWQRSSAGLSGEAYLSEAASVRRKGLGLLEKLQHNKLEHMTAQSAAAAKINAMCQQLKEMEILEIQMETSEGMESVDADIDRNTKGGLTELFKALDVIGARIFDESPAKVEADLRELEALEKRLIALPEESNHVFAQRLTRENEMQRIAQRLEDNGWELLELQRGETIHDDCSLFIQGADGQKAFLRFQLDGRIEIISHFQEDAYKTREKLQQLVLETVKETGEKAKGKCMDGQTETPQGLPCAEQELQTTDKPEAAQVQRAVLQKEQGVKQHG